MEIWPLFLAGATGALISDIIQDNCLVMPSFKDKTLYLGCFGGIAIGSLAGYIIDGSMITAFMGGYVGKSIITSLISKFDPVVSTKQFPNFIKE